MFGGCYGCHDFLGPGQGHAASFNDFDRGMLGVAVDEHAGEAMAFAVDDLYCGAGLQAEHSDGMAGVAFGELQGGLYFRGEELNHL